MNFFRQSGEAATIQASHQKKPWQRAVVVRRFEHAHPCV